MRVLLIIFLGYLPFQLFAQTDLPPMHHVVDIEVPENFEIPDDFPLSDEAKIDCLTCHDVEDLDQIPLEEVDTHADNFFRNGPYSKLTDFCSHCHDNSSMERDNIHVLIDPQGELKTEQCEYCHDQAPNPQEPYERDELTFRLPEDKLCLGCHLKTPHLNAINHLVEVDDEMLKHIQQSEKKHEVELPLEGKRIRCTTCHSAHEKGVVDTHKPAGKVVQDRPVEDGVGYHKHPWNNVYVKDKQQRLDKVNLENTSTFKLDYRRIEYEVLLRLPAKNGELCLACHQFDN